MKQINLVIPEYFSLFVFIALASISIPATASVRSQTKSRFVTVSGVKLHYLDWGGKGPAMLFLAGGGHSAYIFDDIACKFTDSFRVLGLTRRGHGQSDKPQTGYDIGTLVEDIRAFLDALQIRRVILVGHSMAGDEMTWFAGVYPDRVDKLVYLDAAYDRSQISESVILSRLPDVFALIAPSKQDLASIDSYRRWLMSKRHNFWSASVEADMYATTVLTSEGVRPVMPDYVRQAMVKGMEESHPGYTRVKASALSFYALSSMSQFFWLTPDVDARIRKNAEAFLDEYIIPKQREQIERFRREMVNGTVIEMANTNHFCFIQNQEEVVRQMRAFLVSK